MNSLRLGVCDREQFVNKGDEVNLSSTLRDRYDSLPTLGFDCHEQIGGAVAYVLIVIFGWAVGCHGQWRSAVSDKSIFQSRYEPEGRGS
jgi:hypothetical protein